MSRCGKVEYESRADARREARRKHPGEHLRPYICRACSRPGYKVFHLGHPIGARKSS